MRSHLRKDEVLVSEIKFFPFKHPLASKFTDMIFVRLRMFCGCFIISSPNFNINNPEAGSNSHIKLRQKPPRLLGYLSYRAGSLPM